MIKLLIVDDNQIYRHGLHGLLDQHPEVEVIAEVGDGRAALEYARKHAPDVVTIRASLADGSGLDCTRQILGLLPKTKVVAISGNLHRYLVEESFAAGASAFVHEKDSFENLLGAILGSLKNQAYLSPEAHGILKAIIEETHNGRMHDCQLSRREREILQLVAEGFTTQEIAARLHLSAKTIEYHRGHLAEKLGVRNVAGLTKQAIRLGLTSLE